MCARLHCSRIKVFGAFRECVRYSVSPSWWNFVGTSFQTSTGLTVTTHDLQRIIFGKINHLHYDVKKERAEIKMINASKHSWNTSAKLHFTSNLLGTIRKPATGPTETTRNHCRIGFDKKVALHPLTTQRSTEFSLRFLKIRAP